MVRFRNELRAVVSTVPFMEALAQPHRLGDEELIEQFYGLFDTYPYLTWVPVTLEVAGRAAELRARYRLSTPDAIHVATAISGGTTGFIGHEGSEKRGREIECLVLDEVL